MEEEIKLLRAENERLHQELDVALDKACKYDILIDTLFRNLLDKIAEKM